MGGRHKQPLEPGDLLSLLLNFVASPHQSLPPGVIPSAVARLDLLFFYGPLVPGSIPLSVQELLVASERRAEVAALV